MGIGFPPMTGGAAQFMTGYEHAETGEIGLAAFVKRADELAAAYGERSSPPRTCATSPRPGARSPPDAPKPPDPPQI